jgi:hypothetical protein
MASRSLLFILGICLIVSCDSEDLNPLKRALTGTTWTVSRLEILDKDNAVIRTEEPANTCVRKMNFSDDKTMKLYDNCESEGCGDWDILNNNTLTGHVGLELIVPALCDDSNFIVRYAMGNKIELADDVLIIDGFTITLDQFYDLPDWASLITQSNAGDITLRAYYVKTEDTNTADLSCCSAIVWE